jgi:hypothetical protein
MKITGTHLGILIILLFFAAQLCADDNVISLEQSGDNLQLGIDQLGHSNEIEMLDSNSYITATNLDMYLVQVNTTTGLPNKITFDELSGTGNQMKLAQGAAWTTLDSDTDLTWWVDDYESGGHEIDVTMYGDYNQLAVQQTNQTGALDGHDFNLHLAGDHNEVKIKQQSNGAKNLDLTIYNDYNDVFVRQKGNNTSHSANVTLDGLYGTDLILKQLGTTSQTYTLSIDCMTVGGCSATVEQGN